MIPVLSATTAPLSGLQFVPVEFIPTQLCIQSEQLKHKPHPNWEKQRKWELSPQPVCPEGKKYCPQKELMYVT